MIPLHNRADLLTKLLDSMARQTVPFARVVVVDNASTDGAAELARARGCEVVAMGENAGFARAVNRGWLAAATEWIAILNSDVELDERWLERLCDAAGDASYAGGLILSFGDRGLVDGTYDLVSRAGCAWRAGNGESPQSGAKPVRVGIVPGTACIFRRDALEQLGGFDEGYGSYMEDVDLGLRCVGLGLTGIYAPDAIAYHHGSATLGRWNPRVVRLISRNQLTLVARHYDRALLLSCLWPVVAGQLLWGLVALRHGAGFAWLEGKVDGLRAFRLRDSATPGIREFLAKSEREIRSRARDSYWRWYFRFVSTL